jgi:hypothetical protein
MATQTDPSLIAGRFAIDLAAPRGGGGGLPAYAATDRHTGNNALIAVAVARCAPARARALQLLTDPIDGMVTPLSHGLGPGAAGEAQFYVVCPAPAGTALSDTLRPWSEQALVGDVLRPAAHALDRLHRLGLTHRAIRLDNVFQERPGRPVTLGQAWAAPPAMHQPALYEPPYSAMCLPAGRGEGSIADDVYALGVLIVLLALGRVPMQELDPAAVLRRKLELGSFQALVGEARLPPLIADLVRGMLAEDPEHRPPPALLLDPAAARGRRVAARPPRRAQRPLLFADQSVWDARTLAFTMAQNPEQAAQAMSAGTVMYWLRRGLGDGTAGSQLEEMVRHRHDEGARERAADALMVMRAVVLLDPLAPLCWRGTALWPDGLGSALAEALGRDGETVARLDEVVAAEAVTGWAMLRAERCDPTRLRTEARQWRGLAQIRGPAGGMPALAYALCPLLPCASPLVARAWAVQPAELSVALDVAAATVDLAVSPVDRDVAALLAARCDRRMESEAAGLGSADPDTVGLARLRLLAQMQRRYDPHPRPGLTRWVARHCQTLVELWCNRPQRAALAKRLETLADAGFLLPLLGLFDDALARAADQQGARQATEEVLRIDEELRRIAAGGSERILAARRVGQEIAAGAGLAALATVLAMAAMG